jgi:hypothetical protein
MNPNVLHSQLLALAQRENPLSIGKEIHPPSYLHKRSFENVKYQAYPFAISSHTISQP